MLFEDLEIIWREGGSQPSHTIDDEALRRMVQVRAERYRRKIFWRDVSDIGTNALVVAIMLGVGLWRIRSDGSILSLASAAFFVVGIGYGFIGAFIFISRRRQERRERHFEDSIKGNLEKLVANADYQIRRQRKFVWWYLLPIIPGFILLTASTAESGPVVPWIFGAFMCVIFGVIYWGHVQGLRNDLIPKKEELDSLLARLEKNEGQGVEIRSKATDGTDGKNRKRKIGWWAITAVCVGLVGWLMFTVFQPIEEPRTPAFDDISAFGESEIARIESWLQEQVELANYPSLSVVIVRNGEAVYQGAFGYENTWARRKATTNTAYHVASVTKAFTASLAVLLHGRGVIDLDKPVVSYLPPNVSISTRPELGATITLRQLASHTSGLPRGVPGRVQSVEGRYALEPERLYELLGKVTLEFDPGTDDLYSNLGFGLLGHALEVAAGKPLNELLQELVCDPLGLQRTGIHVDDQLAVATGYTTPPQLPEGHSYRERLAGSGGLVTSAGDLGKFLAAQMKPGLFTSEMLAELHSATKLGDGSETSRGLGWSIDTENPAGRILSKNGGRGNCSAWIGFAPDHGVGVAVITNTGEPEVDAIGRWLLERSVPGGSRPATKYGYAKVAPFTGVRWENDRPIVRVEGGWFRVVSIDGRSIDEIMEFAEKKFGSLAQKRFGEDLVELLVAMGHEPEWTVTLGLERQHGRVEQVTIRMTEENRALVRE